MEKTGRAAADDQLIGLSEPQRTLVSLCLMVHLFFVVTATTANLAASPLQQRLLDRFAAYTRTLYLDRSFARRDLDPVPYRITTAPDYLTHAQPEDVDTRIEILPQEAPGDADKEWLVLPKSAFHGDDDYQRSQRLARLMSSIAEDDAAVGLLAQGVATHFARQRGLIPQQIRVRRHMLQPMEALADGSPEERDPDSSLYFRTDYKARVIVSERGVQIVRMDDASRMAPPARTQGARREPSEP